METVLYIGGDDFPPKAARNCKQEIKVIDSSIIKRNINGNLIPLGKMHKLWTRITCEDQKIPDVLTYDVGDVIDIACIQRLWKKVTSGKPFHLKRIPCAHSVLGHNKKGETICSLDDRQEGTVPVGAEFISYRPWIQIMITKIETHYNEWNMNASWMLEGEEV